MLDGLKALLNSEKALASGVLMIFSCVFVLTGQMTVTQWADYTQILLGIYVVGKTVQGGISSWSLSGGKTPASERAPTADDTK